MEEISHLRNLCRNGQYRLALTLIGPMVEKNPLSPFLLIFLAMMIQQDESESDFIYNLEDAEKFLLSALKINDQDIDAMIELAHLYDTIVPKPQEAFKYASLVLSKIKKIKLEMTEIRRDNKDYETEP